MTNTGIRTWKWETRLSIVIPVIGWIDFLEAGTLPGSRILPGSCFLLLFKAGFHRKWRADDGRSQDQAVPDGRIPAPGQPAGRRIY